MSQNMKTLNSDSRNNNNNKDKKLAEALRLMKSRDALRLPFLPEEPEEQDGTLPDIPEHEQSEIAEEPCTDYNAHGRCLGYHPHRDVTLNETQFLPKPDSVFNQTLNSTVVSVGQQQWGTLLQALPTWSVQNFLDKCPKICRPRGMTLYNNPVADKLEALINESMQEKTSVREQPSTSTICNTSLEAGPSHEVPNTHIFDQLPMPSVSKHLTRVRIQPPKSTTLGEHSFISSQPGTCRVGFPNKQENALESWQVMRIAESDDLCVRGKHVRSKRMWRSTTISRRLSSRILQTTSGTVYHIVGPSDNKDNVMPPFIEHKFTSGFPTDWEDLAKMWAREENSDAGSFLPPSSSQNTNKRKTSSTDGSPKRPMRLQSHESKARRLTQRLDKSGTDSDTENSDDERPRSQSVPIRSASTIKKETLTDSKAAKRGNASKKVTKPKTLKTVDDSSKTRTKPRHRIQRIESSDESDEEEETQIPDQNCSVVIKKLEDKEFLHTPTKVKTSTDPTKWLADWRPVINEDLIILTGRLITKSGKTIEENHMSFGISKRLSATLIETDNGTQYNLKGGPCWLATENEEPPQPEIKKKFSKGFPFNWVAALNNWQDNKKRDLPKVVKKTTAVSVKPQKKKFYVNSDSNDNDNSFSAIKITVSSRGRKIIQPLKYWENVSAVTVGKNLIYRNNLRTEQVITVKEVPEHVPTAKKRRESDQPKLNKNKSNAKRPRLTLKKTVKEPKPVMENIPTKVSHVKAPSSAVNGKKEQLKEKPTAKDETLDDDEIMDILKTVPKTLKQRQKRDTVMKSLQEKNTHVEQDLFASSCSGLSSDELSDNSFWDADSVSSKVTSDDDRMKFNYTPPGARMGKFVPKASPAKNDVSMLFDGKKRDRRTMGFVQRQMTKSKNLMTKKQRDEQKAVAGTSAKLMQYKSADPMESKMANAMYRKLTIGEEMSPEAADFFKRVPASRKANDSDSSVEKYYTDDEDAAEMFS